MRPTKRAAVVLAATAGLFVPAFAGADTPTATEPLRIEATQPTLSPPPPATPSVPAPSAAATPSPTAPTRTTRPAAATTKAVPVTKAPPAMSTVRLAPVTAYHSQAAVDQGNLVLWGSQPWRIAGHDNMGWAWLDNIPTGTIVVVTTGPAAGRYKVVGHKWSPTKGDPVMPAWMTDWPDDGLILQTCTGSTGTGFTLAVRA